MLNALSKHMFIRIPVICCYMSVFAYGKQKVTINAAQTRKTLTTHSSTV